MAKLTQWRIHSPKPADADGRAAVMATRAELVEMLAGFNIGPEQDGGDFEVLHGPGIRIHMPFEDPVRQVLVEEDDDSIAAFVLMAIARRFDWKFTDVDTQRTLYLFRGNDAG
ncbi:MAG: hypothetical protein CBC32_013375 [Proteobacteria bacterium TMED72]|nr:MAG: hypothetical protein CBC32_013375 [Proteobacteria bacterium TMED72]RPG20401.1 MAG: hypothetical protein CBB69_003295 [Phycisphaera sp. TMED9]RPG21188.1 MAG: hypothetical protein CBB69_002325 [Phycisphaera sp. TMED9]